MGWEVVQIKDDSAPPRRNDDGAHAEKEHLIFPCDSLSAVVTLTLLSRFAILRGCSMDSGDSSPKSKMLIADD